MNAPVAVLVARLEHELETARLHMVSGALIAASDSMVIAKHLTQQIREGL